MSSKKINNSKYKNTGILFELLVNQITSDTLSGKPVSEALNILQNHFRSSTELGKELQLYRAFFDTSRLSETKAIHFIDLILTQRKKLDDRKLATEKYEVIKEVKKHYDLDDFLSSRVPSYKINSSIYKTFASQDARKQELVTANISEVVQAKFTLVEHLVGDRSVIAQKKNDQLIEDFKNQTEELRLLSYKLAIEKFNEKYSGLNNKQKSLLKEYIENVTNINSLLKYVRQELPTMKTELIKKARTTKDKVLSIKLNEVVSQLNNIAVRNVVNDNEITAMMIAYQILKEIDGDIL
jgi:hypothetical protein